MQKQRLKMFLRLTSKQTVYFVCHTPQYKMLVFAFQSEIWIAQNFKFTVFEDFFIVVMEISIFTKCKPR